MAPPTPAVKVGRSSPELLRMALVGPVGQVVVGEQVFGVLVDVRRHDLEGGPPAGCLLRGEGATQDDKAVTLKLCFEVGCGGESDV